MSWDTVVGEVSKRLPQFNDDLLINFRKRQVNSSPEFMDKVFKESVRTIQTKAPVNYVGYEILPPAKQVDYILGSTTSKDKVNIQQSELQLCKFKFSFENEEIPVYLFLPYLSNKNTIVINDTHFNIILNIIDRLIVRITDGIIIKVMKQPLNFWRNRHFWYKATDNTEYHDSLITVKAFCGANKSRILTSVVLYLLAEYGFHEAMRMFGINSIGFVSAPVADDPEHKYFEIDKEIYLVASTEEMENVPYRRVVASILSSLTTFVDCLLSIDDVYQCETYRMILGKCLYGKTYKATLAAGHGETHLESLRTYLDEITKNRLFLEQHIPVNNIFELFVFVFYNIDDWLVGYSPNNLFEKRLGGIDTLLAPMVEQINTRIYNNMSKNKQFKSNQIRKLLNFNAFGISNISAKASGVQAATSVYNDNALLSMLIKRLRLPSSSKSRTSKGKSNLIKSEEHQFSPTFLAIESVWAISSSSPGISGDINPFAVIDESGRFVKEKMPWFSQIEPLEKKLVQV